MLCGLEGVQLIDGLTNAGALPSLELTMRYAAQRQRLIAHNIANADTPRFVAMDVPSEAFRDVLRQAVDRRREETGGRFGELAWEPTRALVRGPHGLELAPGTPAGGVLYHDRGARDPERLLQALTESTGAFRTAAELYRAHRGILLSAIGERV